jgi:hypothetical protein
MEAGAGDEPRNREAQAVVGFCNPGISHITMVLSMMGSIDDGGPTRL